MVKSGEVVIENVRRYRAIASLYRQSCGRIVEIQKADAVRLADAQAVWKDVGQRLLDDTCQQRTDRHEEDGCWPSFE
jgi:hypothetical protein